MDFRFDVWTLPAHWASAFINDDLTGLEDEEIEQFNTVAHEMGAYAFISLEPEPEAYFTRLHDARHAGVLACDCFDYQVAYEVKDPATQVAESYAELDKPDAYTARIVASLLV
jgi:hypothetical protein